MSSVLERIVTETSTSPMCLLFDGFILKALDDEMKEQISNIVK